MDSPEWSNLSDEELLEKNISKLGLRLEGTELQPLIQQLYDELSQKNLVFHPPCFVGDEWFCPVGVPAIFLGLHVFVSIIQAFVFMLLSMIYLSLAVSHEH